MGKYLLKRLGMTGLVCLLLIVFLSVMPYIVPGDPVKTILGPRASPALVAKIRTDMNLDKPAPHPGVSLRVGRTARRSGQKFRHRQTHYVSDQRGAAAYDSSGAGQPGPGHADRHSHGRIFGGPPGQLDRPAAGPVIGVIDHPAPPMSPVCCCCCSSRSRSAGFRRWGPAASTIRRRSSSV